jgi:MFS family permease
VLSYLWSLGSFRHLALAAGLHALYGYAWTAFSASFFERVHGLSRAEIGGLLGLNAIVIGTLSVFVGGRVGDWLARRGDARWFLWVPAIATGAGIPFALGLYLSPDPYVALGFLVPYVLLSNMYLAPTFAMTQALVPARMRATAAAIMLFVINLIGLALGPQLTRSLSDVLRGAGVDLSLRWALLIVVCIGAAWSTLHYSLAARPLRGDLAAQQRPNAPAPA